jgi:ketosteroid isomerase-like protein
MKFADLIRRLGAAAVLGDGAGVAACFTPDGVYHDVFYGSFKGPDAIADMIENRFHRDAEDFRWDMHDPVEANGVGYARYVFSYRSKLPGHEGRRAVFEGVAVCRLRDGLIADYSEVANAVTGLSMLGFEVERIGKFAARQARELCARGESEGHSGDSDPL